MRLLGLDWGERRIGVAATDPTCTIAYPLEVVDRGEGDGWLVRTRDICAELGVERVVVGLPRGLRGQMGRSAEQAGALAREIEEKLGIEVVMWDERLTTAEAEKRMLDADERRERRRRFADSVAAALMLESYLRAMGNRQ